MQQERERKVRADKKRTIAAPIDERTYEMISHVSYICDRPLKDVGEVLCREGIRSERLLDILKLKFRRNYLHDDNHLYLGDLNRPSYKVEAGNKKRLYMKFYDFEYERFSELSYALDSSVQAGVALLIKVAITRKDIMYPILAKHIQKELDMKRSEQLRQLCRFLDANHPDEYVTVPNILIYVLEKSVQTSKKVDHTLNSILDR